MAEKYLRGEYGTADEVGPYRGSIFYAVDRYDKSFEIKKWLKQGKVVICNRYVSANMGHQAGKIKVKQKRESFLIWLHQLEYDIFGLPKPDLTMLLHMPPEIGKKLAEKRGTGSDIHEADLSHLKNAARAHLEAAKKFGWKIIQCKKGGRILNPSETGERIFEEVEKLLER